jgi:exopolyphosphatase/guanosine-5'-triphosphate,3'-diphosphate pyrophosphatase
MRGVIDMGSNTIRLSVYKILDENRIMQMFHKKYFVGLAGYVDEAGMLTEKGIARAVEVLKEFKMTAEQIHLDKLYIFATASLRNIINTGEVLKAIKAETGFDVQVLSGEEEATYDYIGATYEHEFLDGLLIDIGGGSTELVVYKNGSIEKATSFPFGSLNMFTKFVSDSLPSGKEIRQIQSYVRRLLENYSIDAPKAKMICGVGGTVRSTGKLYNDLYEQPSSNRIIPVKQVRKMIELFEKGSRENIVKLVQVIPERTHTIIPGMTVLYTVAAHYGCKNITVSEYGLREGYLMSILKDGEAANE